MRNFLDRTGLMGRIKQFGDVYDRAAELAGEKNNGVRLREFQYALQEFYEADSRRFESNELKRKLW